MTSTTDRILRDCFDLQGDDIEARRRCILEGYLDVIRRDEREKCARLADAVGVSESEDPYERGWYRASFLIAKKIRGGDF